MRETASTSHNPLHGRRILIVEDVAILAFAVEDLLKRAGAEVVAPSNSRIKISSTPEGVV
jgi:hypothetical protein